MALIGLRMPVYAAGLDKVEKNMVFETSAQTELYEEASDESKIVVSLETGTVVFTVEDAEGSWCKISAGDNIGYIKVEYLKTIGEQDLINQEFEQNMNDNHMIYDEIQKLEEQKTQSEIWGRIILGLIITMLVIGGILSWKKMKKGIIH